MSNAATSDRPKAPRSSEILLEVAEALDARQMAKARVCLEGLSGDDHGPLNSGLVLSLWHRLVQLELRQLESRKPELAEASRVLSQLVSDPAPQPVAVLAAVLSLPAPIAAALVDGVYPDAVDALDYSDVLKVCEKVQSARRPRLYLRLWTDLLARSRPAVPSFWDYLQILRVLSELGVEPVSEADALLIRAGREDALGLFAFYAGVLGGGQSAKGLKVAKGLTDPIQRLMGESVLTGAPLPEALLSTALATAKEMAPLSDPERFKTAMLRLGIARGDLGSVIEATDPAEAPRLTPDRICLRAMALARAGRTDEAHEATSAILRRDDTPWYLKGRARVVAMTAGRVAAKAALAVDETVPDMPVIAGRPLAQSLWVGPRLRWVETLSIRSFLNTGWRYQLYVYDAPENVPDGVELLDAASIVPRSDLFRESVGSGIHRGSLGAFSDLFRYSLLHRRGGLWTDTDVINLSAFDPDGQSFVASEFTDAGFAGPSGAMLAARAGDPMLRRAVERSRQVIEADGVHFSRIGPDLLAELLSVEPFARRKMMPPAFLNPVTWMETAALLRAPDALSQYLEDPNTLNLHVYTETWRMIGLDLATPPGTDTAIGALYDGVVRKGLTARQVLG